MQLSIILHVTRVATVTVTIYTWIHLQLVSVSGWGKKKIPLWPMNV